MGQKTHPLGFRLGITQQHKSVWYVRLNEYGSLLKQDDKLRAYFNSIAKTTSISNVRISRSTLNDHIQIDLETGKPGLLIGNEGIGLKKLLDDTKKLVPFDKKVSINIFEVEHINLNAALLADSVVDQLEKRVAFRRAIRDALLKAQSQAVRGIKIQVSGRLNGAEIARSEWIREGRVPLQTLRADIDYATREAHTIYGVIGIKVWLFKNEILTK